jgi:hypothetical protein
VVRRFRLRKSAERNNTRLLIKRARSLEASSNKAGIPGNGCQTCDSKSDASRTGRESTASGLRKAKMVVAQASNTNDVPSISCVQTRATRKSSVPSKVSAAGTTGTASAAESTAESTVRAVAHMAVNIEENGEAISTKGASRAAANAAKIAAATSVVETNAATSAAAVL